MLFFAAAVLALTACSNEEENTNKDWNEEIRLCTQNLMMTRAGSDIQSTQFAANEQIDVFSILQVLLKKRILLVKMKNQSSFLQWR